MYTSIWYLFEIVIKMVHIFREKIYTFQQTWIEIAIKRGFTILKKNIYFSTDLVWICNIKMVYIFREKIYIFQKTWIEMAIKRWFTSPDQQNGLEQTNFILLLWRCNFANLVLYCIFSFCKKKSNENQLACPKLTCIVESRMIWS